MADQLARAPFPVPFGWFSVGYPEDFPRGEPKAIFYFDRHLVAWRDEAEVLHVQDAFCPHLGAHLGHGGTVDGCEIVCPFHGWKFDGEGTNTDIPYSERTNRKGTLLTYPVVERNGISFVWYHPDAGVEPLWDVPELAEFNGAADWSAEIRTAHTVDAPWQEMAEMESYETGFPGTQMRSSQKFPTPRGVMEGRIDSEQVGPGIAIVRFSGIVDTVSLAVTTPIRSDQCITRFNFRFKTMGDEQTTRNVGQAFVGEVDKQYLEDKPIWEHKAHLVRPALAAEDGPFMKFRKWAAQFYAEPISDERLVFPPPWDPARADEAPAKATASAKLGDD
jgi:nitrite reductase/ring-hydroxylating ferredoxin subunit